MFILVHYFHLIPISHHAPFHLNGCIDFVVDRCDMFWIFYTSVIFIS